MNIEKGIVMTQTELEQVATHIRDIGLHASWNDLLAFTDNVVGNLVDAYQTVVGSSLATNVVLSPAPDNVLQEKLYKAIASLTNEEMVARWRTEACGGDLLKMQ